MPRTKHHEWRRLAKENACLAERSQCRWAEPNDGKGWPDLVRDNDMLRVALHLPKWKPGNDNYSYAS